MNIITSFLSNLLTFFYSITNSYGLAIIFLTLFFRLVTFPLNLKQIKSTKAMNALMPERKKLEEKYKNDKQALNQAMMELYAKHKINPLAGCLPILIQFPIFIAMFRVIQDTSNITNTLFFGIDLAKNANELGFPLGAILPALAGITTYLQSKQSMADNPAAAQGGMGAMTSIMPIMIVFFSWSLPAGLALYWTVGNVFGILQHSLLDIHLQTKRVKGDA
jgi:YidC/Oxa1 family membrane protein insertase